MSIITTAETLGTKRLRCSTTSEVAEAETILNMGTTKRSKLTITTESSMAAEIIGCNNDLLAEILVRLQPITLTKFLSVSRLWESTILSSSFSRYHYNHHHMKKQQQQQQQQPYFILHTGIYPEHIIYNPYTKLRIPVIKPGMINKYAAQPSVKILQSSHGLLLVEVKRRMAKKLYLYNPMTRQFRNLLLKASTTTMISGICLAFDPSQQHYKVGCVKYPARKKSNNICTFQVYDSATRTWNALGKPFTLPFKFHYIWSSGVHFKNRIYWIGPTRVIFYSAGDLITPEINTLCIDLDNGSSSTSIIKIPWMYNGAGAYESYIMESNGYLHCLFMYHGPNNEKMLLVMEWSDDDDDKNAGWVEKYSADLSKHPRVHVLGINRGGPGKTEEEEEEFLVWFHDDGTKIISFRFSDKTCEVIHEFREEDKEERLFFQGNHAFVPSLAPV